MYELLSLCARGNGENKNIDPGIIVCIAGNNKSEKNCMASVIITGDEAHYNGVEKEWKHKSAPGYMQRCHNAFFVTHVVAICNRGKNYDATNTCTYGAKGVKNENWSWNSPKTESFLR